MAFKASDDSVLSKADGSASVVFDCGSGWQPVTISPRIPKNNSDLIYIPINKMAFIDNEDFEPFRVDRNKKLYKQLIEQNKLN